MERQPRVLVVTENASLVIGLTFLTDAWEVVSQATMEPGIDADVAVIDLRSLDQGVRALQAAPQLPAAGAVVIGDGSPDIDIDIDIAVRFLPRPFVFLDLAAEIDALLASHADRPVAEPSGEQTTPADGHTRGAVDGAPSPEGPGERGDAGATGLFGRLKGMLGSDQDGAPGRDEPQEQQGALAGDRDPPDDSRPAEAEPLTERSQTTSRGETIEDEGGEARARADHRAAVGSTQTESPTQRPAPSAPPPVIQDRSTGPATSSVAEHVEERQEPPRRARWFARRAQGVPPRERELRARLAKVLSAASELELLIDEVPALASLEAIGRFLVDDLVIRLEADCAGFWQAGQAGWHLVAGRGLTAIESRMVVPYDQPLFSEVHRTGGGLLVDPVEQAQAAVAGIGGAHTESFMAAAIAVGPGRYGILSVGRDQPLTASHLDLLLGVALEAAPGIAVAEQLLRLWARAPQPTTEPQQLPPRSWRDPENS